MLEKTNSNLASYDSLLIYIEDLEEDIKELEQEAKDLKLAHEKEIEKLKKKLFETETKYHKMNHLFNEYFVFSNLKINPCELDTLL